MTAQEQVQLFRQLAVMLGAGMQIAPSLEVLARAPWSPKGAEIIGHLESSLYAGQRLSSAMGSRPETFDRVSVALVKVGENTGSLVSVVERLADLRERHLQVTRQLKTALTYPLFLTAGSLATLGAMILYFVPRMAEFVASFDVKLSWPVRLAFDLAAALADPWVALGLVETVVAAVVVAWLWCRTETGRLVTQRVLVRLPVVGRILVLSDTLRVTFTLALTQACGHPLNLALRDAAEGLWSAEMREAVRRLQAGVVGGETLAAVAAREELLAGPFSHLLAVGEEVGQLERMCRAAARLYEEELALRIDTLTSLLEPLLLAFMGAVVGGTVVLLFLPMAQILEQL